MRRSEPEEARRRAATFARSAAEKRFYWFFRQSWPILERDPFVDGWHIEAVADHLQALHEGEIQKLLITVPYRSSKSLLCSVCFPAWVWSQRPSARFLCLSYAERLAEDHSLRCRDLITSPWYQSFWPEVKLRSDESGKLKFANTSTGVRIASSFDGMGTGVGGNYVILDDPMNAKDARSKRKREHIAGVYKRAIRSRQNQFQGEFATRWVLVMQRLGGGDLADVALAEGDWEHLCIPQEFEPHRRCVTVIGWADPRTEPGELMCPARFSREFVEKEKDPETGMGALDYAAQHQQRPSSDEGGCFKRFAFRWYTRNRTGWWDEDLARKLGHDDPDQVLEDDKPGKGKVRIDPLPELECVITSWDFAVKKGEGNSFSAGGAIGRSPADSELGRGYFVLDSERAREEYTEQKNMFRRLAARNPDADIHYVEDKALGPALINEMRQEFTGIVPVDPRKDGDKEQRARAVSPLVNEARVVWLPHPREAPWVWIFLEELCSFPRADTDDQVDWFAQGMRRLRTGAGSTSFRTGAIKPEANGEAIKTLNDIAGGPPTRTPIPKGKRTSPRSSPAMSSRARSTLARMKKRRR